MRKISAVLSVLLCAVFLTACGILPAIFAEPTAHATAPQETVSVTAVATLPTAQTLPQTQPTESVPPTVEEASVHSPLYMADLLTLAVLDTSTSTAASKWLSQHIFTGTSPFPTCPWYLC